MIHSFPFHSKAGTYYLFCEVTVLPKSRGVNPNMTVSRGQFTLFPPRAAINARVTLLQQLFVGSATPNERGSERQHINCRQFISHFGMTVINVNMCLER